MKMIEKGQESKQEMNTEIYLKKKTNKKREYGRNKYHMSEEKKQKLKYQKKEKKNYSETKKLK